MKVVSTRGNAPAVGIGDAIAAGLAPDGGLYMPEAWPSFAPADFDGCNSTAEIAARMLAPFFAGDVLAPQLAGGEQLIAQIHLRRKAHDGRDGAEQGEDRPHEAVGRRGQAGCEHAARTAAPGGTIGKRGAQARFRP